MLGGNIKTLPDVKSMISPNSRKFQTNFSSCPKLRQVYAGMTRLSIGIRMKLVADSALSCRTVGVFGSVSIVVMNRTMGNRNDEKECRSRFLAIRYFLLGSGEPAA